MANDLVSVLWGQLPEVCAINQNITFGWLHQTDQMSEQGTFATATTAHDDEDITPLDGEIQVLLDNKTAVRHRQVINLDMHITIWCRSVQVISVFRLCRQLRSPD